MKKEVHISGYHASLVKPFLDYSFTLVGLIVCLPLIFLICLLIKIRNGGPILFRQKRVGKGGEIFTLIKFRTMKVGSEKQQSKVRHLNEADGPVFKIYNDPRYTKFGKFLARSGFDELPQFFNVLVGKMSLVGPRPLPIYEAKKLTKTQKVRELVKPGITSSWVVSGAHNVSFKKWMLLDKDYVASASLKKDIQIIAKTLMIPLKHLLLTTLS